MEDQVAKLQQLGLYAERIHSGRGRGESRRVAADYLAGRLDFLFIAPERFQVPGFTEMLARQAPGLVAIDEAHCISQWGHDFRPDYMTLGQVITDLGVPRVAAFTATATERVRRDIAESLRLRDPLMQVTGFLRPNLHLSVVHVRKMREKIDHLVRLLRDVEGGAAVVYCATRGNTEKVAQQLRGRGFDAREYHGGMGDEARSAVQEAFAASDDMIIVATNAFGMGVDKANVRVVAHYDVPGSLEAYYQEAGRAGRDGAPARCVLLFTFADTRYHEFFIDNGGQDLPPDKRAARAEHERQSLRQMVRYAYDGGCRHSAIVHYFGESLTIGPEGCGACDVCTGTSGVPGLSVTPGQPGRGGGGGGGGRSRRERAEPAAPKVERVMTDAEEVIAQKVLSAVARSQGRLGVQQLARLLGGRRDAECLADPLAATRSYGILADVKVPALTRFLKALGRAGCTHGARPTLTGLGVEVMHRRASVPIDLDAPVTPSRRAPVTAPAPEVDLDEDGHALLERLRAVRLEAARERSVPAFTIASNKLLARIAAERPLDHEAWLAIHGVGERNAETLRELFDPVLAD
jgi:ATP-dependent DNA helicase RecQ